MGPKKRLNADLKNCKLYQRLVALKCPKYVALRKLIRKRIAFKQAKSCSWSNNSIHPAIKGHPTAGVDYIGRGCQWFRKISEDEWFHAIVNAVLKCWWINWVALVVFGVRNPVWWHVGPVRVHEAATVDLTRKQGHESVLDQITRTDRPMCWS